MLTRLLHCAERTAPMALRGAPRASASAAASAHVATAGAAFSRAATKDAAAPLQPFHIAFPVHDLDAARGFYAGVLRCEEGRSSKTWIDYSLFGHQIVCHWVGKTYRAPDFFNDVDADSVPVPHFGVCLTVPQFHALRERLTAAGVTFIVAPHLRFEGKPGEQWTMFFKDPSGNSLEFKAMSNPANLFAKYYVAE
jgi:extradiol dioxygenase family protein